MRSIELIKFLANDLFDHVILLNGVPYMYKTRKETETGIVYGFLNTRTLKLESFNFSSSELWQNVCLMF